MKDKNAQEQKFEAMLEEATIDCYGEEEEFSGVLCALEDKLKFPFGAVVLVRPAKITGIDAENSSLRGGILLKARIDGCAKEQGVALFMVDVKDKGSENARWIEFAKWWGRRNG